MKLSEQMVAQGTSSLQPISQRILVRFGNSLDCLTAHLMLECAEVLAGVKPANLISIVNRTRPCGRNLYHLWQRHQAELASRLTRLNFMVLQSRPQALLLLCYNPDLLEQHLAHAGIRTLLHKAGYAEGASGAALVAELAGRIGKSDCFPHEIGLFIGYPAKDVAAFMGMVKLPYACQGPWKIYGNPARSLALAEQHRCCRQRMGAILATGDRQVLELNNASHPFFRQANENDCHYRERASQPGEGRGLA